MCAVCACNDNANEKNSSMKNSKNTSAQTLFESIPPSTSKVHFTNRIAESPTENYFSYNYFYNGAGVALGDINNDGYIDVYFAGNQVGNKLYQNNGNFNFTDISKASKTDVSDRWCTGASMIDINADGWLDIYVCAAGGSQDPTKRKNLLFVNQRDGTFIESAEAYGLADPGYSTQAYFWDYDKDNDVDIYVVNHRVDFKNNSKINSEIARDIHPATSDQLYENRNGKFINVTEKAGIQNKAWGLSASIADFDENGWPDIYVTNDFLEPDLLYLNQKDGTFIEASKRHFKHISFYGMGSDVGDINNDGHMDLFVLDMVSEDHVRSKRNMASMSNTNFWNMVKVGYHYQYMANTLQLNNGQGSFSEIASLAGISKTDWSWAPLIVDFDMDGYQDIFVTNGIKRDVTDNDFKIRAQKVVDNGEKLTAVRALEMMTSAKISNYAFKNKGDLTFSKSQKRWGLDQPLNSNGAMYADLDNDNDFDLVINNIDAFASIYSNSTNNKRVVRFELKGPPSNPDGIGATINVNLKGGGKLSRTKYPNRGFMSSFSGDILLPLGNHEISEIEIIWSDGKKQTIYDDVKSEYVLSYEKAVRSTKKKSMTSLFQEAGKGYQIDFIHQENQYDDFIKEILLPHRQSRMGPALAIGDINVDGHADVFFGNGFGQSRSCFIQESDMLLKHQFSPSGKDKEDVDAIFFDVDGDGDQDLYVACGGNEYLPGHSAYQDELLINNGKGSFYKSSHLPTIRSSSRCVSVGDYDGDNDLDLFVGGGSMPQHYPRSERSYLLKNENGKLTDATPEHLQNPGIVSDVAWSDIDADGDMDLLISGEWMPVMIAYNENGVLGIPKPISKGAGWYFHVSAHDINKDGRKDIIAGNIGKNNKFQPSYDRPLHIYLNDFDKNGSHDIVLSKDKGDYELPIRGRECSSEQMPFIQDEFPTYQAFAEANLTEIYGDELSDAFHLEAHDFAHHVFFQQDDGEFSQQELPNDVQRSPLMAVQSVEINGTTYYAYAGNFYPAEVETIRYDAGIGGLLVCDNGTLMSVDNSGVLLEDDTRKLVTLNLINGGTALIAASNNGKPKTIVVNHLNH